MNVGDLPETMFRTTTFDDSTDERLTPVKFRPIDEAADDEWYADGPLLRGGDGAEPGRLED